MSQTVGTLYSRFRTGLLLIVAGLVMLLSFLWYLPGAYHAGDTGEFHAYAFPEFRFNNVIDMYVNHNLQEYSGPGYILGGTGIEYPALLSMLIRASAGLHVSDPVPFDVYRSGTPQQGANSPGQRNVVGYTVINYTIDFAFGLLLILLMARWRGAKPWLLAASPLLFIFAGYNWDLIPIALSLAGVYVLKMSSEHPDKGRTYNRRLEILGFALLTVGVWVKLFPIVFLIAALVQRGRQRLWWPVRAGAVVFAALSLAINLPFAIANFDGWRFFLWIHQQRPAEPTIWYWLVGGMDPAVVNRTDVTSSITTLSLVVVVAGGLGAVAMAWFSKRRDIVMPMGCLLLVWWLTFNKVYDPNFDLWVLFALAILGATRWLYASVTLLSISWWLLSFIGLTLSQQPNMGQINYWYLTHPVFYLLLIRLAVLGAVLFWLGRALLTPEAGNSSSRTAQEDTAWVDDSNRVEADGVGGVGGKVREEATPAPV